MRYAIITIKSAESIGISADNHFKKNGEVIVNEREIEYSDAEGNNFEEKIAFLSGEIKSKISIKKEIKNGWKL